MKIKTGWLGMEIMRLSEATYLPMELRFKANIVTPIYHNRGILELFVSRLAHRVSLVEQELLTLQEHPSSSPVFSGVRVTRSLVLTCSRRNIAENICSFCVKQQSLIDPLDER
jgi:hypothetical protein